MAKFCVKCGKPLEEGEVCSCQVQQPVQQATTSQPIVAQAPVMQQPVAPSAAGIYLKRLWAVAIGIFKAPATMLQSFVAAGDIHVALGFIIAHALAFAIFLTVFFNNIGSRISNAMGLYSSMLGSSSVSDSMKFPLVTIFFVTLLLTFGLACLFAAILLLFNKTVFKAETTYNHMLCVVSAKSIAVVPFMLVGILVAFISINWASFFVGAGILLAYFYVATALKGASAIDENKAIYTLFLSFVLFAIATGIVIAIFYSMYLPSGIKSGTNFISSLLN